MADGLIAGRRLQSILVFHLVAWGVVFLRGGPRTEAGLLFQIVVWVVVPFWLVRQARRGSTGAIYLFALMLAFMAAGNTIAVILWALVPEDRRDWELLAVSGVLMIGYATSMVLVWLSPPTIIREVKSGRELPPNL
jgi:hypothetical protein